jgi:hypothetical protein
VQRRQTPAQRRACFARRVLGPVCLLHARIGRHMPQKCDIIPGTPADVSCRMTPALPPAGQMQLGV